MRKHAHWIVAAMVIAGLALFAQEAQAFYFGEAGSVEAVDVPEDSVGEMWAVARTESWKETRNTVWTHCRDVIVSYQAPRSDIEKCELDVARVNEFTARELQSLREGSSIILPLTKDRAEEFQREDTPVAAVDAEIAKPNQAAVVDAENAIIKELRDQVALLEVEVASVYSESRSQSRKEDERFALIISRLDALTLKVQEAQLLAQEEAAMPMVTAGLGGGGEWQFPSTEDIWSFLTATIWGPFLFLGIVFSILMILVLVLRFSAGAHRTSRALRRAQQELSMKERELNRYHAEFEKDDALLRRLEADIARLDKELEATRPDFGKRMYEFDNGEYPIKLFAITQEGRIYTTPFADSVLEKNLKSHFAQALKQQSPKAAE